MNFVCANSSSDIPVILISIHPWWNHHLQQGVSQPIADSFSFPLKTIRNFAQKDVDPSNVSVVSLTLLSDESSQLCNMAEMKCRSLKLVHGLTFFKIVTKNLSLLHKSMILRNFEQQHTCQLYFHNYCTPISLSNSTIFI